MSMDYNSLFNPVALGMPASGIRRFFDLAEKMPDAISLGVGEPDFKTPWHIREEGIKSLQRGATKYTPNVGMAKLLEAISRYMKRRFDLAYRSDSQVLVTVGGSEAIDLTIRAFICPGDEVIIPEPSFVCYKPIAQLCGAVPVVVQTRREDNFKLTPQLLRAAITSRTKLLVLPFPNNPTGAVMTGEDLEAIAQVLRGTDIIVLADEIYAELTYGRKHVSIASIDGMYERTVVVNGFSKAFAMTGWRLGFACAAPEVVTVMKKIHQYAIMCAPTTSQIAAIAAMENGDDDVERMVREYGYRRRIVINGFNELGLDCFNAEGAFYVFPSIHSTGMSSMEFCEKLLQEEKVAVIPGTAFGQAGEGFIRCSYAYSTETLEEALSRIGRFLKKTGRN